MERKELIENLAGFEARRTKAREQFLKTPRKTPALGISMTNAEAIAYRREHLDKMHLGQIAMDDREQLEHHHHCLLAEWKKELRDLMPDVVKLAVRDMAADVEKFQTVGVNPIVYTQTDRGLRLSHKNRSPADDAAAELAQKTVAKLEALVYVDGTAAEMIEKVNAVLVLYQEALAELRRLQFTPKPEPTPPPATPQELQPIGGVSWTT